MLTLETVAAGYHRRPVLLGVDLELPQASATALLGRNGVGKTTLMRTVIGELRCSGGRLRLDDTDITGLRTHDRARRGIAYVPQGRHVFAGLSVHENLRVAAQAIFGRAWRSHVDACFEDFPQLKDKRDANAESLSGGQQQILALARAMVSQPRLLLLDEPSEGISPAVLEEIVGLIGDIRARHGVAVLIAEQNLGFVGQIAEHAAILHRGAVAALVSMSEVEQSEDLQRRYLAL